MLCCCVVDKHNASKVESIPLNFGFFASALYPPSDADQQTQRFRTAFFSEEKQGVGKGRKTG